MTAADRPIVVVGSVNMDLVGRCEVFPGPGETVLGGTFATVAGGKGGNQAIAAARAGAAVSFVGAIGDDVFGEGLAANLSTAGVGLARLRTVPGSSGVALITVDSGGENTIVVLPGANAGWSLDATDRELIGSAALLICQLEVPLPLVIDAAVTAAAAGVTVLLNPSPAHPLPTELIAAVGVLVLNAGEARALGSDALLVVPHLVTTLGARGATYRGPDHREIAVPAPKVAAIDTTGAGDAFTGALAARWAAGDDPVTATRMACVAGALATLTAGADSAPTLEQITGFRQG